MNISRSLNLRSIGSKIMLGFVMAVLFGSLDAAPAFARDGDRGHDRGSYRGDRHDKGHYDNRGRGYYRDRHGRRVYHRTVYREQRVYVPPPVYYEPPPPAGIGLFFPSITIRP